MRVALVTREFPPETAWGGIGTFYGHFAAALADAGHEIEVFTQGLTANRTETVKGVTVHRIVPRRWVVGQRVGGDLAGMGVERLGVFALSLAAGMAQRVLERHRIRRFDLVEGHEHLGINALLNVAGQRSFVTVTRYHGSYHSLVSRGLEKWPASKLITWLEKKSARSAHARIAGSAYIDGIMREDFPGTPRSDAILPHVTAIAPDAFAVPINQREKLLIFVGRLVPVLKNPEMAAEAFAGLADRFPDWRIEFAGLDIRPGGGPSGWELCEAKLAHLSGRYCYHGQLSPERLQELYRRARISVMPSRFESFGLVALESMAAGTIPIVSDETALPEVVGDGGVIFRSGSLSDLSAKLESLMRNEGEQIRLSEIARARAMSELSPARIMSRNLELFETLLARRNKKRQ